MLPTARDQIRLLLLNPVFLSCVFSWLGAQFIKTIINLIYGKIHSYAQLLEMLIWKTGGMPSSHSALVTSLCTSIAFRDGICSDLFILSLSFFLVVIRDAFGVRRSSGLQSKKINLLGKELEEKKIIDTYKPIKEVNGHSPIEVIFGCIFGLLVGASFSLLN
ncbi:MAG: divergent PAP2 family protein [Treponema sp.]|jgi:uncharacterized protein|nr:divergent PAP2 family protein [Treponema sp.]